ncbi:MAG TPA: DUF4149 domain-containing protein [Burkholderiaceae bacterium]
MAARFAAVVSGLWAGILLCIAAIAAPSAFATLASPDAGRFVARVFMQEAYLSLGVAIVLFVIERQRSRFAAEMGTGSVFSANLLILLGTLFCTVAGYFAIQPMMVSARAGQGSVSFMTLHAVSGGLYALKGLLVLALTVRLCSGSIRRA